MVCILKCICDIVHREVLRESICDIVFCEMILSSMFGPCASCILIAEFYILCLDIHLLVWPTIGVGFVLLSAYLTITTNSMICTVSLYADISKSQERQQ